MLGAKVPLVFLSCDTRNAGLFNESHETALELFYKAQITPWLTLKPDLQYIVNSGGDSSLGDTLVGTLRVEVAF